MSVIDCQRIFPKRADHTTTEPSGNDPIDDWSTPATAGQRSGGTPTARASYVGSHVSVPSGWSTSPQPSEMKRVERHVALRPWRCGIERVNHNECLNEFGSKSTYLRPVTTYQHFVPPFVLQLYMKHRSLVSSLFLLHIVRYISCTRP